MNERAIFSEALDRESPAERAAYLDAACAGDPALRERVEALLRSHEEAGEFPGKLAPQRLAGYLASGPEADATRTSPAAGDGDEGLDFLEPSDKPGSIGRLGHYEVREVVGRGGMGVVLKAFDESLHRVVAIKVMAPQLASSATARRRFAREARAAAAVTHEHVVTIHAVEESGPLPHIVMQFVAGVSLQDRLDRSGPLPLPEILRIGMQTASGLAAAHAQGLVHRDVKPANILLENGVERVKLTDFGLARAADDASLTQSGTVAGTPSFMSPEQAEGKAVDHRSDLFSLGSVLYAMCTGRPPFRASTNMGVLKRVCEETPASVRETNPELPDWLAKIIGKLHAKDPAARFQPAAEVAELLGRHLAQVQHPSVVPLPAVEKPASKPAEPAPASASSPFAQRRSRWAAAAAVLVATLAILGTTEATGLTNVRATVIRLFTPDGALVIETDDPAVKVVVEGDGDLVITGTGSQEVRLRAGSYRLKATRDGKPVKLDRDLVAISRNGREIVRVRLEGDAPVAIAAAPDPHPFVVLGGKGVAERKFDTLAEAVLGSADGDTIEVCGNGPFVCDGVTVLHRLVIRAGTGYTPSISFRKGPKKDQLPDYIAVERGGLVLEGLELESRYPIFNTSPRTALQVVNCRLSFSSDESGQLFGSQSRWLFVRNSILISNFENQAQWLFESGYHCKIDNCVSANVGFRFARWYDPDFTDVSLCIRRNTLVGHGLTLTMFEKPNPPAGGGGGPPVRLELSGNVAYVDVLGRGLMQSNRGFLHFNLGRPVLPTSPEQAEAHLLRFIHLEGKQNVYRKGTPILSLAADTLTPLKGKRGQNLADWDQFWGQKDTGSLEGEVRFQGGDLTTRARFAPQQLTAEDFRLRPESAGYGAGKDKKDLGADIDFVGPGPAYERWKKTPDYQQWLVETGQVKK